ncbi:MAG: metal-sensing transcriptional repressor, partial [Leifsonia sp.]
AALLGRVVRVPIVVFGIVTQLAAVSKALDRAGFAIIANAMRDCVDGGVHDEMDAHELERLFLSLA